MTIKTFKPYVFEDHRGEYVEIYNKKNYPKLDFVQDDISVSTKGVLRGIHGDKKTWKLISCLYGKIQLAVVEPNTPEYQLFVLSDRNRLQVLIPPGFGNGHLVLSDVAIFHYKQTTYYDRKSQFTLPYNDVFYNIPWATVS